MQHFKASTKKIIVQRSIPYTSIAKHLWFQIAQLKLPSLLIRDTSKPDKEIINLLAVDSAREGKSLSNNNTTHL